MKTRSAPGSNVSSGSSIAKKPPILGFWYQGDEAGRGYEEFRPILRRIKPRKLSPILCCSSVTRKPPICLTRISAIPPMTLFIALLRSSNQRLSRRCLEELEWIWFSPCSVSCFRGEGFCSARAAYLEYLRKIYAANRCASVKRAVREIAIDERASVSGSPSALPPSLEPPGNLDVKILDLPRAGK